MNKIAICTISSKNFMAQAKTLLNSILSLHDDVDPIYLVADKIENYIDKSNERYEILEAKELNIPGFNEMAFKYDIVEFNVALKPFLIKELLNRGYDKVLYFDADIMVFNKIDILLETLDNYSLVITPHILSPIPETNDFYFREKGFLKDGAYNMGFIGVSNNATAIEFLDWWSQKCLTECYREVETGLFVDQKWVDLVPSLFDNVCILRHPGCNMGYWNLHERLLNGLVVNGRDQLIFYHFSGLDMDNINGISKYQKSYTLADRADLIEVFELYKVSVFANNYTVVSLWPYAYGKYDNGKPIGLFARRLSEHFSGQFDDLFATGPDSYFELLRNKKLLENPTSQRIDKSKIGVKVRIINSTLKLLQRMLGIDRFSNLMAYMRYISTIRHQSFLIE